MSIDNSNRERLMDNVYVYRHIIDSFIYSDLQRNPTEVTVQVIGDAIFLEIDGSIINIEELAKYRKVFNANTKYMYYLNLVSFYIDVYIKIVTSILLFMSFFTKSFFMILTCLLGFLSSLGFLYSLRLIDGLYLKIVHSCFLFHCLGIPVYCWRILQLFRKCHVISFWSWWWRWCFYSSDYFHFIHCSCFTELLY